MLSHSPSKQANNHEQYTENRFQSSTRAEQNEGKHPLQIWYGGILRIYRNSVFDSLVFCRNGAVYILQRHATAKARYVQPASPPSQPAYTYYMLYGVL